jgi:hypothetical protein
LGRRCEWDVEFVVCGVAAQCAIGASIVFALALFTVVQCCVLNGGAAMLRVCAGSEKHPDTPVALVSDAAGDATLACSTKAQIHSASDPTPK